VKYILIYTLSVLFIGFIWYRGFEIPNRIERIKSYSMESSPPPQEMGNDTTIVYLEREPVVTHYPQQQKSIFDYVNEILTTIIGLINIITFGYQMKDRKSKKEQNERT